MTIVIADLLNRASVTAQHKQLQPSPSTLMLQHRQRLTPLPAQTR
jgi:hypothetical protein